MTDARPSIGIVYGAVVVDSLQLAEVCCRPHSAIMDAARKAWRAYPNRRDEFVPAEYRARNGRTYDSVYLGYRALAAVFEYLENMPGRFDKAETLFQYRLLFVQSGVLPADEPMTAAPRERVRPPPAPEPEPAPEPPIPWPAWAITEGHLINAVWDELLTQETAE